MLVALLTASLGCSTCDVRTLPGSDSLQEAIDQAEEDDNLLICPGVYEGTFTVETDLTLTAIRDRGEVWLDGLGAGPVLTIRDAHVGLDGLGIDRGGTAEDGRGGGLWIQQDTSQAPPYVTLTKVTIRGGQDSGIVITSGTLLAQELTLQDNQAPLGGGLRVLGGGVSLSQSSITGNDADLGGGLYVDDGGEVVITESRVCQNSATNGGGAWLVAGSSEEEPGLLTSIQTDWCEQGEDNSPDDVATLEDSYLFGDNVDFNLAGPEG